MLSRSFIVALGLVFPIAMVVASPAPGAATGSEGGCNTGSINCCKSVQKVGDGNSNVGGLLAILGLLDLANGTPIGLTCNPITVVGGSTSCTQQPVCCTGNNYNGLVVVGCSPLNVGL